MSAVKNSEVKILHRRSGTVIQFPCHGRGPSLFLEWMCSASTFDPCLAFGIKRISPDPSEIDSDVFQLRLRNHPGGDIKYLSQYVDSCVKFISENYN